MIVNTQSVERPGQHVSVLHVDMRRSSRDDRRAMPEKPAIAYFDVCTKNGLTQEAGFQRPFLACLLDPSGKASYFRAPKCHRDIELSAKLHLKSGGVIDQLMCHVLLSDTYVQPAVIYVARQTDLLFVLEWVMGHRATYGVEVGHVGTRLACVEIEDRSNKQRTWLFEETKRLLADEMLARRLRAMDIDPNLHEDDFRWPSAVRDSCERMQRELVARAAGPKNPPQT